MRELVRPIDSRERAAVQLWRKGHLSPTTITIYLQWVRRFQAYCERRTVSATDHLTEAEVRRFTRSYVGPRLKRRGINKNSQNVASNALHACAFALQAVGTALSHRRTAPADAAVDRRATDIACDRPIGSSGQARLCDRIVTGHLWPWCCRSSRNSIARSGMAGRHTESTASQNQHDDRASSATRSREGIDRILAMGTAAGEVHSAYLHPEKYAVRADDQRRHSSPHPTLRAAGRYFHQSDRGPCFPAQSRE